jgi:hypothetical protein
MNQQFFTGAFALGAAAVLWVAQGFLGTQHVALAMTLLIALVYGYGALELHRFRRATSALHAALGTLTEAPHSLGDWLDRMPLPLQNPVRMRIEGERVALPGPSFTPYLLGLLVMLGMLGTFLGMVVTLNGAVFALEGSGDVQAIRTAFAEPIKGLGLAFGTSVAGVATSAMLGLMSAMARRERMQAGQLLDARTTTVLRSFSHTHQRQETYKALQLQAQALPEVVHQLHAMMGQMERMGQQLNARLLANQEGFHADAKTAYTDLAHSVDQSLRESLRHSAQLAGESIQPAVERAMSGIAANAAHLGEQMVAATHTQLDGVAQRFQTTVAQVSDHWAAALTTHQHSSAAVVDSVGQALDGFNRSFGQRAQGLVEAVQAAHAAQHSAHAAGEQQRLQTWTAQLETMAATLQREWREAGAQALAQQQHTSATLQTTAQHITEQAQTSATQTLADISRLLAASEALVQSRVASEAAWTQQHAARMDQLANALRTELSALRTEEAARGSAAAQRLDALQAAVASHLTTLGTALEDPITRLIHTASEAPRAAAEVIGKLREEVSNGVARDNALLEERSRILETLNSLLASIHHASAEQRGVIDALVASSAVALQQASGQFAAQVGSETDKLADIAASVTSSAVDVSALGETLGFAVKTFGDANDKLIANLQRIEGAMDKAAARSDDQLAYYVAQAREVIDLSIMSQKEIVEALRQLPGRHTATAEAA